MSKKIKLIFENKANEAQSQELNENMFKNLLDLVNVFGNRGPKPNFENLKDIKASQLSTKVTGGAPESLKEIIDLIYPSSESEEDTEAVDEAKREALDNLVSEFNKYKDPAVLWKDNGIHIRRYYANTHMPDDPILDTKLDRAFGEPTTLRDQIGSSVPFIQDESLLQHFFNQIPQGLMPTEKSTSDYVYTFNERLLLALASEGGLDPLTEAEEIIIKMRQSLREMVGSYKNIHSMGIFNRGLPITKEKPVRDPEPEEGKPEDAPKEQPGEEKPEDAPEEKPEDATEEQPGEEPGEGEQPKHGERKMNLGHWGNPAGYADGDPEEEKEEEGELGGTEGLPTTDPTDPDGGAQGPGIPIYKFQSRDAAGPDGKRTQPLISKLMKAGLPKSVVNTVVKSIVKDLKASNVPFYESKEQLTNVLKEHIKSALLGRLDEATTARSLARKAAAREEAAKKVFKDLKDGESVTINRSDTEALSDLKQRFPSLASALMRNKLINGTYTKKGEDVKYAASPANSGSGETKSSLEKKQDNQPGSQLDPSAAGSTMAGVEQELAKEFELVMMDNGIKAPKAEDIIDFAKPLEDLKADTSPESVEKEAEARSEESFAPSTKDAPELWVSLGKSISNKPQVMGKGNRLKKNAFSELNWSTVWSGTPKMQYRDGLGRKEKELWIKMIGSLKASVLSNINYKLDSGSSKDFLTLWQVAMDDESRKEVTKAMGQMKDFMKAAVQKQANIRKALAAKLRLKSGKRGGGEIQLSVLNQQLDTISGPGLEGRDSKIVGGKRTPGKQAMTRNKETGKMEPMFTTGPDGERVKVMAGASRRQKSMALKTVQQHLKPYLRQYGLKISEAQETALGSIIIEMYDRFGGSDPQIFGRILKEALSKQGLIK